MNGQTDKSIVIDSYKFRQIDTPIALDSIGSDQIKLDQRDEDITQIDTITRTVDRKT